MNEILHRHRFSITFLTLVLGAIFILPAVSGPLERFSGFTMGTSYEVQVVDIPNSTDLNSLTFEVGNLLTKLDKEVFSTYAEESELSRLNQQGVNVPFTASDHLLEVLRLSKEVATSSNGAFDVGVGSLVNLWGFGPGEIIRIEEVPDDEEINTALEKVGIVNLLIDETNSEIIKTNNIYIDLSGIAKGYAVDQVAFLLFEKGVENYFIEVGGEIKLSGSRGDGEDWVPAIETPQEGPIQIYETLTSQGETFALAGSGDYRNYFEIDGERYSHEIDPRTGRPVSHNLAAAFVIDESAAVADAYATALMVLGPDQARALLAKTGINGYLIFRLDNSEFDHYASPGFIPYINN